MFKIFCFFTLLSLCLAAPVDEDVDIPHRTTSSTEHPFVDIVESGSDHKEDGSYSFYFRGEDGSYRQETAVVVNPGTQDAYLEVTGSYSYFDVDGIEQVVHYKADKHGFVPEGGNIPVEIATAAKHVSELADLLPKTKDVEETTEIH